MSRAKAIALLALWLVFALVYVTAAVWAIVTIWSA